MNTDRERTEIYENENGAAPQPSLEEAFMQLDKIIEKLQEPDAPLGFPRTKSRDGGMRHRKIPRRRYQKGFYP